MSLLSSAEDADLQTEILDELVDNASIYDVSGTTSDALGYSQTFTLLDTVACRYAPQQRPLNDTVEKVEGGGLTLDELFVVTVPRYTTVTEKCRIVVQVTATGEFIDFEVVGVKFRTLEFTRQVSCRLIR